MGVHDPLVPEIVLTPDLSQKMLQGQNPAGVLEKQPEKIKFFLGELHFLPFVKKMMTFLI